MQTSLRSKVRFAGVGLHTGARCVMHVLPAGPDHGIVFERVDCPPGRNLVPALWSYVCDTEMSTSIGNSAGVEVKTIEHLMAAFVACGIHNARVRIDGPEVPIKDGSALPFVYEFLKVGRRETGGSSKFIRILQPVRVTAGDSEACLEPSERAEMDFSISFRQPIGRQARSMRLENGTILSDLVTSRTFCLAEDIDAIHARGLGRGGTKRNTIVVGRDALQLSGRLRCEDEFVRHKMLDAVGDLSLAGFPILGRFRGHKSGHRTTAALLRKLLTDQDNYSLENANAMVAFRLPGSNVHMDDLPPH